MFTKPSSGGIFATPSSTPSTGTTGALFGSNPTVTPSPAPAGSLFSTPGTSTPTPGTGLFGSAQPSTTSNTGGGGGGSGLFGSTSNQPTTTTSAPSGGALFGTASSTGTGGTGGTGAGGGGLFSAGSTAPSSAPSTGGLFGSTPTTSAPTLGGFFGSTTTPSAPPSGGMFGGTAPTSTPSTGGLFGSAAKPAAPSAPSTGGGLFGNAGSSTTPASKPSLSIFGGAPSTAAKPSLLTTTPATTTAQTGPTPSVQQAVKIELHNLAPYHKFHELTDALRGEVEAAEKYILSEIQKSEALAAAFPEHREMIQSVSGDAELMERRLLTTNSFLESDTAALQSLIKHQKLDDQHASLSVRTLDLLRLPHAARMLQAQYATTNPGQPNAAATTSAMGQSTFQIPGVAGTSGAGAVGGGMIPAGGGATPTASAFAPLPTSSSTTTNELEITSNAGMIGYFTRHGAEMEARLKQFLESVAEVEASLRSVEVQAAMKIAGGDLSMGGALGGVGGGAAQDRKGDARKLNAVLREFYDALNDVSSRVVEVKEGLRELKAMTSARGGRR